VESGTAGASTEATTNGTGTPAASEQIDVRNPATGESIAKLDIASPDEVAATVARVRANQPDWEAMGIEGRYHWLGKLRDWILDNESRILDTMQQEPGKVRADASTAQSYQAD
jgi:acyl-CoA reductase-like NAD-dependent aldehyde dehydrogenase